MDVQRIAVLGAGTMGHGIAQVAALAGYQVTMRDVSRGALDGGRAQIDWSLDNLVRKGRLEEAAAAAARERLSVTTDLGEAVAAADLVIEAVPEDLDLKLQVFAEVDRLAPAHAVLTSNTSQFSITRLAAATARPERVCGMHFFNPPVLMKLVEIARGARTSDETHRVVVEVSRRMGKETVTCKDSPGFITTRLIGLLWVEAMRILEEGVATAEDIDKACRLGLGHAMGPLETADWSGLDVAYAISQSLREHLGERFQTTATHRNLVYSGALGRKTGKGIYEYR
ncbi:MAG: 3-hydroxyacyl-CoA dehydrogenase family protein [Limnochordales bacterium]|nr:3-hydroxyacyl-CoA dehydrogenase family protein [Limnochordales bacterium]